MRLASRFLSIMALHTFSAMGKRNNFSAYCRTCLQLLLPKTTWRSYFYPMLQSWNSIQTQEASFLVSYFLLQWQFWTTVSKALPWLIAYFLCCCDYYVSPKKKLYTRQCLSSPLTSERALRALIDFTLSNARRFYSSKGNPLDGKGLENEDDEISSGHEMLSCRSTEATRREEEEEGTRWGKSTLT